MTINPTYSNTILFSEGLVNRLALAGFKAKTFEDYIIELASKSGPQIQDEIAALESKVDSISTKTLPAGAKTYGLSTKSVDAVKLTNRSVDYTVSDNDFIYDFSDLKSQLPTGYAFLGGNVSVIDAQGKKTFARGNMQSMKIGSFPATANVSAQVKSPSGTLELERTLLLTGNVEAAAVLDLRDTSGSDSDLTQSDFNALVSAAIVQLQQK